MGGEVSSPPAGMYSLAEVNAQRTMHWLKKPVTTSPVDKVLLELVTALVPLAPLSSDTSLKGLLSWANGAAIQLLQEKDSTKMIELLLKWLSNSQYDLGM